MTFIPEIETKSATEISRFQQAELGKVISYVSRRSPYYQKLFREHGIVPASIQSLENLKAIPFTSKEDLQRNNWDFLCVSKQEIIEYTSTSGTLGKPVTIALTERDLKRLGYNEQISFACADGTASDLYQLMLTLDRQFMAGMAYYHGVRQLGGAIVRVGPGLPSMQMESIERLEPTVLVAVPSFLVKLIEYADSKGVDLNKTSVQKAVCIGEAIRRSDLTPNIIGRKILERWNIQLYGTYASTEMQTAFTECRCGTGGHHHPELIIVELVDDAGEPVEDGVPGEVVITTLGVEGMPLLRYRTGDICIKYGEPCPCGRHTFRLGPVLGRKQQLIKFKGTTIYPPGIFEILNDVSCVKDYVVEVYTGDLGTDELRIYVVTDGPYQDDALKVLSRAFQSHLRVIPQINITSAEALDKMQHIPGERKPRRFIDSRSVMI